MSTESTGEGTGAPATPPANTSTGQVPPETKAADTDPYVEELRRENAKWRKQLRDRENELEKVKTASLPDQEKAIAEAKAAGAAEYQNRWRAAVLDNAALTALAEKQVVATELALRALDLSDLDIDPTTGRVDRAALEAKIDDLVKRYPMLAPDAPPPGVGPITGADQRRVQANQLVKGPGESEKDALNRLARYALGGQQSE